jgi:hypothetical protein
LNNFLFYHIDGLHNDLLVLDLDRYLIRDGDLLLHHLCDFSLDRVGSRNFNNALEILWNMLDLGSVNLTGNRHMYNLLDNLFHGIGDVPVHDLLDRDRDPHIVWLWNRVGLGHLSLDCLHNIPGHRVGHGTLHNLVDRVRHRSFLPDGNLVRGVHSLLNHASDRIRRRHVDNFLHRNGCWDVHDPSDGVRGRNFIGFLDLIRVVDQVLYGSGDGDGHGPVTDSSNRVRNFGLYDPVEGDGIGSVNGALDGDGNGMGLRVVSRNGGGDTDGPFDELFYGYGNINSTEMFNGDGSLKVVSPLIGHRHRHRSFNRHSDVILNESIVPSFVWEDLLMFVEALNRYRNSLFNDVCASKGGSDSINDGVAVITPIHDTIGSI